MLPLLRRLDPETAHGLGLTVLRWGLAGSAPPDDDPVLAVKALGIAFRNPVGLAAGFDKDGVAVRALFRLGFGCVEVGTLTPRPQPGNDRPRMFRLTEDRAVINRMGFNNRGMHACLQRLQRQRTMGQSLSAFPLGINLGINKTGSDPERDYPALVKAAAPFADYLVINVSSPNTPGLRDLQAEHRLRAILNSIAAGVTRHPPLLVKLAPDLAEEELETVVEACVDGGVQGLIVSNTTISRPGSLKSRFSGEVGGLSGAPLFSRSTAMLAKAYLLARGRLVLIGVGGIQSGRDAMAKLRAGATLVQVYTAFAYGGPAMIPRLKTELAAELRKAGFKSAAEAVGTGAKAWAECSNPAWTPPLAEQ
jgi:dihydroorotate dehydrogenase